MFNIIREFEEKIANFFGAPYAVATDCCTHAVELCLIKENPSFVTCPKYTYLSIPMTFEKLKINWEFRNEYWKDYYQLGSTKIYDAAVLWQPKSYIPGTYMCLSFQYKKHLSLGRGGAIMCETYEDYIYFKKLSYDGRLPDVAWAKQKIESYGYHYYMTPETAKLGLDKLPEAMLSRPKIWSWENYPNLTEMPVFNREDC